MKRNCFRSILCILFALMLCFPTGCKKAVDESAYTSTCTISISCKTLIDAPTACDKALYDILPKDGMIQEEVTVGFTEGESVFDVLLRTCQKNRIHMEYTKTPLTGSVYVEGIHNLYEFDAGPLSGWLYSVNGVFTNLSCSEYILKDGDRILFQYTLSRGEDVGGAVE